MLREGSGAPERRGLVSRSCQVGKQPAWQMGSLVAPGWTQGGPASLGRLGSQESPQTELRGRCRREVTTGPRGWLARGVPRTDILQRVEPQEAGTGATGHGVVREHPAMVRSWNRAGEGSQPRSCCWLGAGAHSCRSRLPLVTLGHFQGLAGTRGSQIHPGLQGACVHILALPHSSCHFNSPGLSLPLCNKSTTLPFPVWTSLHTFPHVL